MFLKEISSVSYNIYTNKDNQEGWVLSAVVKNRHQAVSIVNDNLNDNISSLIYVYDFDLSRIISSFLINNIESLNNFKNNVLFLPPEAKKLSKSIKIV